MKTHVFIRVYGVVILFAALLIIRIMTGASTFSIFANSVFLFSILMIALLTQRQYIHTLSLAGNELHVRYMNRFFQSKSVTYDLQKVSEVKLSKRRLGGLWPPYLGVKQDGEWKDYSILSKEQYIKIEGVVSGKLPLATSYQA